MNIMAPGPLHSACSAWWLTGWQRKWIAISNKDAAIRKVFYRTMTAEDRYQRVHKMGPYSLPTKKTL